MSASTAEIIVVRYGQPDLEQECLQSVRAHTNLSRHTLTIVDNFERDKNLGALWNELIERSKSEFICLLNSDTRVEPGWLDRLVEVAEQQQADAVGPISNRVGYAAQLATVKEPGKVAVASQLSGFCLLLRRSAWSRAKGFREDFTFYGQESDLMRRIGKKVIARDVFIWHCGGASVKGTGREQEEHSLRDEFWRHNVRFDWGKRIALIGLPGQIGPLWAGLHDAVREFRREDSPIALYDARTVTADDLHSYRPEAVIWMSGSSTQFRAPAVIGNLPCPRAFWFNDLRQAEEVKASEWGRAFDRMFLCFQDSAQYPWSEWAKASGAKISYMPQGSRILPELAPLKLTGECVFIGDLTNQRFHGGRAETCSAAGAAVLNAWSGTPERTAIENQSSRTYREYRFALSLSPAVPGYSSLRLYNILAYGGLALVSQFPGLEQLFHRGKHLLTFHHPEEAVRVMREYRAQPENCEAIRKRGWRYQQAKHTVMMRLMNMVSNLTTADQTFWGFAH